MGEARGRLRWGPGAGLAAALVLAACSGGGEGPLAGASPSIVGAAAGPEAGVTVEKAGFNPFAEPGTVAVGGREVIQNPTIDDVMLAGPLPEMAMGRADAPVTIIKYASLTCPYCRRFQLETFPVLKRELIDTGKVRFIIREFPIGYQSGHATIAWRCAGPDRFFDLYDRFMKQQASWVSQEIRLDPIYRVVEGVGMSRAEFDSCFKNQAMIDGLRWVKERGRKLGVIGTPNFFINGRLVKTVIGMKEIREHVEAALTGRSATAAAR